MELLGDGDTGIKLIECPKLPCGFTSLRLTRCLVKVLCFLISLHPCQGQTFSKCLPEQREANDPKEEEEVSSPEERETMDLKEGKEASLPWKWQNIDLEEEEEEITSPEEGETCERKEEKEDPSTAFLYPFSHLSKH